MNRKGSAVWKGGLKDGNGVVSTESGVLKDVQYSFSSRFEDGIGSNPEELLDVFEYAGNVPLVVLPSPFRSLIGPIMDYVDEIHADRPHEVVTVIVPEAVSTKPLHRFLQENVAAQLKAALGSRQNVVVTNVRYFLD